jgi:FAD synthase
MIRQEMKFEGPEALVEQLKTDREKALNILKLD